MIWERTYCKFNSSRLCNRSPEGLCYNGVECTKDPNRFKGREITKGQKIYLLEHGWTEEKVAALDFESAGREIKRIKSDYHEHWSGFSL